MPRPPVAIAVTLVAHLAVLVAAGWATGALLVAMAGADGALGLDRVVLGELADRRNAWLTTTMRHVTSLGTAFVLLPLVAVVGVAVRRRVGTWTTMAELAVSLGGAILLYDAIKVLVARPRPPVVQLVSTATGFAFPSGHATQMAAVTVTLAILGCAVSGSRPRAVVAWGTTALLVGVVGVSRIYLGVHWPTDVLAGGALGALWAVLTARTLRPLGCSFKQQGS